MKYTNELQKQIVEQLQADDRFYYHGYTGTFFFMSYEKGEPEYCSFPTEDLKRLHSGKNPSGVRILIFSESNTELVNYKIEIYLNSYCEWYTFFEGWVDNIEEFNIIFKAVGLSKINLVD